MSDESYRERVEREARLASEHLERKLAEEEEARRARTSEVQRRLSHEELAKLNRPEHDLLMSHIRAGQEEDADVAAERDQKRRRATARVVIEQYEDARARLIEAERRDSEAHAAFREAIDNDGDSEQALLHASATTATVIRLCVELAHAFKRVKEFAPEALEA